MYFSSFLSLVHMGGYADYVWPAFGLVVLVLFVNVVFASRRLRNIIKNLRNRYARSS